MPNEFSDKMLGGIILTGGGSNMRNIVEAFHTFTPIEKIRIAKFVNGVINANQPEITAHDGRMNTVLGLLERGNENCAGKGFFVELHDDSSFAAKGSCVIGLKAEALHLDVLFFQLMIDLFRVGFVVKRKCVRQGLYGVFEVRERDAVIVILQDL